MHPDREAKLKALRALLRDPPGDETAVFMDEVDVNLNPRVGCQWMRKGEQSAVETPGTNEEQYLAGSIHWRTGRVFLTEGKPCEGGSGPGVYCDNPGQSASLPPKAGGISDEGFRQGTCWDGGRSE
jgi:hypothetical protein